MTPTALELLLKSACDVRDSERSEHNWISWHELESIIRAAMREQNAAPVVADPLTAGSTTTGNAGSAAAGAADKLHFSNEGLRRKILSDPDDEPSAGNCPQGDDSDDHASKNASGERDEVRRPGNPDQPDVIRSGEKLGLPGRRVGRGQHVQQVHTERGASDDHPEPGTAGQVRGGAEVLRGLHTGSVATPPPSDQGGGDAELRTDIHWLRRMEYSSNGVTTRILSHIASLEAKVKEMEPQSAAWQQVWAAFNEVRIGGLSAVESVCAVLKHTNNEVNTLRSERQREHDLRVQLGNELDELKSSKLAKYHRWADVWRDAIVAALRQSAVHSTVPSLADAALRDMPK